VDREHPDRPGEEPDDGLEWLGGEMEPAEPGDVVAPAPVPQVPEPEAGPPPPPRRGAAGPPAPPTDAPHGRSTAKLLFLGFPLLLLLLVGWNRAASSDRFCASCHATSVAELSSARSIHADVPCVACHSGAGLAGTIKYVPTLLREGVATVTGFGATGVLTARSCASCHPNLSPAAHRDTTQNCVQCHGEVSHPVLHVPGAQPFVVDGQHPKGFIQVHGQAATNQPTSCAECHAQKFCEACHLKETFPHPDGWISKHGAVQQQRGAAACTTCHGPTFCAGCHGTEIPHASDWLGRHGVALRDASTTPCMTCHPPSDCTTCHSEHSVHNEQDLYVIPSPQPLPSPSP
jgi:hypothetical protein